MKHYFERTRVGIPPFTPKPYPPEEQLVDFPPEKVSRIPIRGDYWERDSSGHISDGFLKPTLPK